MTVSRVRAAAHLNSLNDSMGWLLMPRLESKPGRTTQELREHHIKNAQLRIKALKVILSDLEKGHEVVNPQQLVRCDNCSRLLKAGQTGLCARCKEANGKPLPTKDMKAYAESYAQKKRKVHERWLREQLKNSLGMEQ